MDAASYSYTEHGFKTAMDALKNESEAAWEWLSKIPKHTWARHAMDMNCKTDLVVNNLSEVFNKWVLDVRAKPIRTMVDGIRTKLMVKFNANRTKAETVRWEICPTYAEKLEEAKKFARNCHALMAGPNLYQVTSGERTYAVNLQHRTCGCKKWDMTAVPCNHAVSAIHKAKLQPEDFVHDFFKKKMYLAAYSPIIYPVPGPDMWPRTDSMDIEAPVFKEHKGRAQTKRRKGQYEKPAPKDTSRMASITCSNCKKVGHRYTNCNVALNPSLAMRKNRHEPSSSSYELDAATPARRASSAAGAAATAPSPARRASSAAGAAATAPSPAQRASSSSATAPGPAKKRASSASATTPGPAKKRASSASATTPGPAKKRASSASATAPGPPKKRATSAAPPQRTAAGSSSSVAKGKTAVTRSSAAAKGERASFLPPRPTGVSQRIRKPTQKIRDYLTASGAPWE
ncbi:neurofilament heavy polypeptide isoform X1 [Triticum aestivum]|uniref:neurofilament heavy polypeptide isoform X1 n=1 Tax=Triticum aestivum TaxID=4565 RepID=UPI000DF52B8C|nr:neurofilament heavy polypeptide-like isoform X1 [Triticum aestivum]XP_044454562.1 neurofilament heavy polypeptide-like isoform X1 [Triticum aestivum]XP_044454563.1 neurofilament heavy polypeptide-like isoform X1 [Triticum aestivum]